VVAIVEPVTSSVTATPSTPTVASTSAFVRTTSSMLKATRSSRLSASTQATVEIVMSQNQGLGASATGGIAAGITVAGIAILAALI
jgi:hypothetical protein